jgi:membrane-bound lytic murein transglycosylase B
VRLRLQAAAFVGGLAVLSSLGWLTQRQTSHVDPVLSFVGPPALAVQPAAGPAPVTAAPAAGASSAVAPGPVLDPAWVRRTADAAGIPEVAVAAYARASLSVPSSCRLGWTTLAGIGWVESQHGTIGGRVLEADGLPSSPILGPALDGGLFAAIPATARSAAMHGDQTWDHAVGPLQFLPSTWERWARDGDGDGAADPQDIDDASAAAAAYLCATGADLSTGPGWSAAVFAYNHSDAYVQSVYSAAVAYAARTAR